MFFSIERKTITLIKVLKKRAKKLLSVLATFTPVISARKKLLGMQGLVKLVRLVKSVRIVE